MLSELMKSHSSKIGFASKVIGIYEFELAGESTPPDLFKVKILETNEKTYHCRISHYAHASNLAGPHRPGFEEYNSEEEALLAAFAHGLMNYDPKDSKAKWEVNESF